MNPHDLGHEVTIDESKNPTIESHFSPGFEGGWTMTPTQPPRLNLKNKL